MSQKEYGLSLGDETYKVILNASCTELQDTELGKFLRFVRTGEPTDEFTDELLNEVNSVKRNERWEVEYMTLLMRDREKIEEGRKEGRKEAWEEAIRKFVEIEMMNGLSREEAEKKVRTALGNLDDNE